ncbi:MAG: alpha/beta fold hydrolase, partial [Gammaproteobacteria bacterium]|nr:alpha/beta fold hydrolase [Gammaproteobacteria bacterium]
DLPGMGYSKWSPHIQTIHDIADLVLPELPENAIYIGWSFGGLVALSIGARYSKRMKRFIGIGTTPNFMADNHWIGLPKPGYAALVASIFEKKSFHTFVKEFYEQEFTNTHQTQSPLYLEAQKICDRRPESDIHVIEKIMAICDATDLRNELTSLTCPIDFIFGDQDTYALKSTWPQIAKLNPNTYIHEIIGAGHAPFWTHPEKFNAILNHILKDNK